jgi:1,4-alpha-glucan branching enzyme
MTADIDIKEDGVQSISEHAHAVEHFHRESCRLTDFDIELFRSGKHYRLYEKLGPHLVTIDNKPAVCFAVWAPNAKYVSVVGNFNGWNRQSHPMHARWDSSGIWELSIEGLGHGEYYKYYIETANGYGVEKGDPYAAHWETPPRTATVTWHNSYKWTDEQWLAERKNGKWSSKPFSIYEVHLGSWRRIPGEDRFMTYLELANELPGYLKYMGYTHVEFLPITEHPFYGSWGYQVTGYFAPSSRYGTPEDLMHLINQLHKEGIGVILDWVPSHFPDDEHGLSYFDGTFLYEHEDPKKGYHPDWRSYIFNYGRNEVRSFLISSAMYWLDKFHIDGLRVDAVASMLYLNYSRKEGEWTPNEYGGVENLEAIGFLRELNDAVHLHHPDVVTIAEESTAWPGVTHPTSEGGLGFDMKWMMGWMHDTLYYFALDPVYRSYHQNLLSFSIYYFYSEKFLLPLSHDEIVYGKGSLLNKMPGDYWQQFANLRLLYGYMYGHPGAKLIFMGGEFAQRKEWAHDFSLEWDENNNPYHNGVQLLLKDLNHLYRDQKPLHQCDFSPEGFEWISFDDSQNCVIAWVRKDVAGDFVVFVANYTPVVRHNYRIGVPKMGYYEEVFNTDNVKYGGSNILNSQTMESAPIARHSRTHSISFTLPPLAMIALKWTGSNI